MKQSRKPPFDISNATLEAERVSTRLGDNCLKGKRLAHSLFDSLELALDLLILLVEVR